MPEIKSPGPAGWGLSEGLVIPSCQNYLTQILHIQSNLAGFKGKRLGKSKLKAFGIAENVKVGTWNVRGLAGKETELVKELQEKHVNICVLSHTKRN